MNKISFPCAFLVLLQLGLSSSLCADVGPLRSKTVISDPIRVDRVYKSMEGPFIEEHISLSDDPGQSELLWLKNVSIEFIEGREDTSRATNYLCHSHIFAEDFVRPALFTLIQGQNAVELPGNFAVPVLSNEYLQYYVQVLNLQEAEEPFDLRVKTTVDYIRDADVTTEMKPLYQITLVLKIPIDDETVSMIAKGGHEGCAVLPGLPSKDSSIEIVPSSMETVSKNPKGDAYSYHWYVPPGKHTYTYDLAKEAINAESNTTVHFATVHLHPYGKSMELFDLTTNTSVLKVDVSNYPETGGIERVNYFYSEEGLPLYHDHRYRITTEYDNPTQASVDAMAFLYLYLDDLDFDRKLKKRK